MAKQTINIGTNPNDSTGDPLRTSFSKINTNFTELYGSLASLIPIGTGFIDTVTVTAGGSGYTIAPLITFTGTGTGGAATAVMSTTGAIKSIAMTHVGSSYISAPTISFTATTGSGATAVAKLGYPINTISIISGQEGTGYTTAPIVVISGSGTGATATATVSGGQVTGVTVTNGGSGYYVDGSAVTISFTPTSGGSGAAATSNYSSVQGTVERIDVTAGGTGYSSDVAVVLTGGSGSGATATARRNLSVASITVTAGGSGYSSGTTVNITPNYAGGQAGTVTDNATAVVGIGTNTWTGAVITGQYGGTGVANTGKTITLGGNLTTSGAFATTFTSTATTSVTLPTTGTLATLAGAETLTNKTLTAPIINDTNGNEILGFSTTAGSTDYLIVKNGIGVSTPLHMYAAGDSSSIDVHLQPKGLGLFTISDGADFNKGIRFRSSSSASSAITLIDAVSTAGRVVTLPDATDTLVGRATTDTLTNKTAGAATTSSTAASLGYLGVPQNEQAGDYTLVISDAGKHIYMTTTSTLTIPANASVAFPIGTQIEVFANGGTTITISITSDGLFLAGVGNTGTRTLAAYGWATLVKAATTGWIIRGSGLT